MGNYLSNSIRRHIQHSADSGFLLPGVMLLCLAIAIFSTASLNVITTTSTTLSNAHYKTIAESAAKAGIVSATTCVELSSTALWTNDNPLVPSSDCSGNLASDTGLSYVASGDRWRSTYAVAAADTSDGSIKITSTGTVTFLRKDDTPLPNPITVTSKAVVGSDGPREVGVIKSIDAGHAHTCALTLSDLPYCWGNSNYGQIGDSDGTLSVILKPINPSPRAVTQTDDTRGFGYSTISAGAFHTCGIVNAKIVCWGGNGYGQLGVGTAYLAGSGGISWRAAPLLINDTPLGGRVPTQLESGGDVTCAIASARAYCWGQNGYRQVGAADSICAPVVFVCLGVIRSVTPPKAVEGAIASRTVVDISTNLNHSCGVDNTGRAYCWGNNSYGQIGNNSTTQANTSVAVNIAGALSGKNVSKISNGTTHTCAIAGTDDELFCWGDNRYGELGINNLSTARSTVPINISAISSLAGKRVTSVSAGKSTTCVVADSQVYCWGKNDSGQLGLGMTSSYSDPENPVETDLIGAITPTLLPSEILAGKTVTQVSIKDGHGCAVADSIGYCWGNNANGQLGDNKIDNTANPVAIRSTDMNISGRTASDISIGIAHTCAISSGRPLCWGQNGWGQLGNGQSIASFETTPSSTAGTALNGKVVTNITTSGYALALGGDNAHSCVIADGDAYCWGASSQVGSGGVSAGVDGYLVPVPVKRDGVLAGKKLTDISAGYLHTCAVGDDKRAYCWGSGNTDCQLGNGSPCAYTDQPVAVSTTTGQMLTRDVSKVTTGYTHSCAIAEGRAYCWGTNAAGHLGDGTTTMRSSPVAVNATLLGSTVTDISAGLQSNCAVSDGKAYCWGLNNSGQLAQPTTMATSNVPVLIEGPLVGKTVTRVSAGGQHACALVSEGDLYCWGLNDTGQLGNGTLTNTSTPTLVQKLGSLAEKTITHVTTNVRTTCVLADSKPYCWGSNSSGQLGDASTTNRSRPTLVFSFDGTATPPISTGPTIPGGIIRY